MTAGICLFVFPSKCSEQILMKILIMGQGGAYLIFDDVPDSGGTLTSKDHS